jgi:hypothetical protein
MVYWSWFGLFLQSRTGCADHFFYIPPVQWHKCETPLRNPLDSFERQGVLRGEAFLGHVITYQIEGVSCCVSPWALTAAWSTTCRTWCLERSRSNFESVSSLQGKVHILCFSPALPSAPRMNIGATHAYQVAKRESTKSGT